MKQSLQSSLPSCFLSTTQFDTRGCRAVVKAVDPILRNVQPPLFLTLKTHRLKFGSRAPEFVSMSVFSATPRRIVLHARMRFVGDDLQAVLFGLLPTGPVFAGATPRERPTLLWRGHSLTSPSSMPSINENATRSRSSPCTQEPTIADHRAFPPASCRLALFTQLAIVAVNNDYESLVVVRVVSHPAHATHGQSKAI
jgi:hypothetical protein